MGHPCGAVVSLIRGDTTGVLRCVNLLEQIGMIACFDTQNVVQTVRVEGLEGGAFELRLSSVTMNLRGG